MDCHGSEDRKAASREGYQRVALIGNPNVGKSVTFALLTGQYATVSNYPGTTVEVFHGNMAHDGKRFLVVDTPGVNSLMPMSEDERVTRDILLDERVSAVIQVGDSKNLRRTLALTIQLAEMDLPVVLDLNMQDEARDRGITINTTQLCARLGIEVISTVAPEKKGFRELRNSVCREAARVPSLAVDYGPVLEEYIENVSFLLPEANISKRSLAVMILSGDESIRDWLNARLSMSVLEEIEALRGECARRLPRSVGMMFSEARLALAGRISAGVTTRVAQQGGSVAEFLGRMSMHPVWGLPILLLVLLGLYGFVGVLGADILVGLVEEVIFGEYLNPMFIKVVESLIPIKFFQDLLVGEYGIITMAITYAIGIVLPITTTFFIVFSILEDSGYLPRLAIMSNKIFKVIGLSGKSVLPMVLGLGCGTMAVMTTRILETKRERIIATFLLALAVPCAAQLGVIMGMLGALSVKAMFIWIGCVLIVLLVAGYLASKVVPGDKADFFLEIPPIRMPSLSNVLLKTVNRAVWYLKEAVPLFIYGTLALFTLDKLKVLGVIQDAMSPVIVGVLGLPPKAAEAFLIGFFRRDYGAAGLYAMAEKGQLEPVQMMVSLLTLTLFVPCLAHLFMMIKERGARMAFFIFFLIIPLAVIVGGVFNWILRTFEVVLV